MLCLIISLNNLWKNSISNKKDALLLMRYDIGYMFQNNALVDDYTVKENPNIVLKYSRFNKKEKVNAVKQALATKSFRLSAHVCISQAFIFILFILSLKPSITFF